MKDGGPAFPEIPEKFLLPEGQHFVMRYQGMTLRDYFAAAALQGMVTFNNGERLNKLFTTVADKGADQSPQQFFAQVAYTLADAMLAEREKP